MIDIVKTDTYAELSPFSRSESLNLFSHWYPKIKDCGLKVPQSLIVPTPEDKDFFLHFYMEHPEEDEAAILNWVKNSVVPALEKSPLRGHLLFVKNGCFSNKFDARYCMCLPSVLDLTQSIININYQSLCADAGGEGEIVLRERIRHDPRVTPCFYNGLPLRPEFRVFYDFSKKEPIFTANYWDYDYVFPHLYNLTDKIIFDHQHNYLDIIFQERKEEIQSLVAKHMQSVEGLEGPWSIDIMIGGDATPFLIDMAIAERSAYWEYRPGNEAALAAKKEAEAERHRKYLEFCEQNPIVEEVR